MFANLPLRPSPSTSAPQRLIPRFGTLSERHARTAFSNMKIKTILLHSFFLLAAAFTLRAADVVPKDTPKESSLFVTGKDFESMDDRASCLK